MAYPRIARVTGTAAVTALAVLLAGGCGPERGDGGPGRSGGGPAGQRPNVLLIVVDTLRRDHLGAYGYARPTSPNIDRLAAESVRYERAVSQAPWTLPSVGSLLTSRQPAELGLSRFTSVLGEDAVLLSEVLARHGYATGAVVSHRFCSSRWGFAQGFDVFDEDNVRGHGAVTSPDVSDRALAFLDAHRDEPFFLWLHYFDVHFDYIEHPDFDFPRPTDYQGPIRSGMEFQHLMDLAPSLRPADLDEVRRIYDSEIAFTDHHIGRVLDHLRESGLMGRTVVVLTADHGEEFREHGRLGHARTLYQEVVAVPLLVRIPGRAPGVVATRVPLLDVFPTVLAALSLPPEPGVAGVVLPAPGDAGSGRVVFTATERHGHLRAALDGDLKLIHRVGAGIELYDLASDPGEQHDLTAAGGADVARLRAKLAGFEEELGRELRPRRRLELSGEDTRALEALGYAEDGQRD